MRSRVIPTLVAAVVLSLLPAASLALEPYEQNFEGLLQSSPTALAQDGWLVYGNVFTPDTTYIYGYGPFPAPNHSLAFCQIALGQGGPEQGEQVLSVFSDYENIGHASGNLIESNVYQEQVIDAADVGSIWSFVFQRKRGNIAGATTAKAFIKTLDPSQGYLMTNFITKDMTAIPETWAADTLVIRIRAGLENQLLQIGFMNTATYYEGSGIFYDNLAFNWTGSVDVPETQASWRTILRQNAPNPFDRSTRIGFSLAQSEQVELSIVDVTGRQIAVLSRGERAAGPHQVFWNGLTSEGGRAPGGAYWYVLKTRAGEMSGRMILAR